MNIVILDGETLNPGDCDWKPITDLGPTAIYNVTPTVEDIAERTRDADVVLINKVPLKGPALKALPKTLKLVCVLATGYDVVDLAAMDRRGVPVCNVVAYGVDDVAQHTMAMLLGMCRRVSEHSADIHDGGWGRRGDWCYWITAPVNLVGMTIGLVGFGSIGRRVGELAHAFGMKVLANCRTPKNPPSYGPFAFATLDQLLAQSDVVSLHCPLTPETRGLIGKKNLRKMKPGAMLINVARGGLLDEAACAEALADGRLAGLAADVLSTEPPRADNPLLNAPGTLLTPHMAWTSRHSRQRIITMTADNIRRWADGTPINVVNRPEQAPCE